MTTLTMMERTATGWKCPRCGDTQEDHLLSMQWVACNCAAVDASRGPPNLDLPLDTVVTMAAAPKPLVCHAPGVGAGVKVWENASGHVFASGQLAEEDGE